MHRRQFLGVSAGAMGAARLGADPIRAAEQTKVTTLTPIRLTIGAGRTMIEEAPRRTPVAANADVLVVGGGVAGLTACLTLAQKQRRVVLVEREHVLGGGEQFANGTIKLTTGPAADIAAAASELVSRGMAKSR